MPSWPIISRTIWAVGVSATGMPLAVDLPSLSTVSRSPIRRTSSSRWEMYTTPIPDSVSRRITRNRLSTSSVSSTDDGSSMITRRALWDSARAIATIWRRAADSRPTSADGEISGWPSCSSSVRARSRAAALRIQPKVDNSCPSRMLSATDMLSMTSSSW